MLGVRVMSDYSDIFNRAFNNYRKRNNRPGSPVTIFDWARHSHAKYPRLEQLDQEINERKDDAALQKEAIILFLTDPDTSFRSRSFSRYLLDELYGLDPKGGWGKYDPTVIKAFKGIVYRGCTTHPGFAFNKGIIGGPLRSSVEDYINDMTGSWGTSTSKVYEVAEVYVTPQWRPNMTFVYEPDGTKYVYKINYRGTKGIDIYETYRSRCNSYRSFLAKQKMEVNILETIPAKDIMGVWIFEKGEAKGWVANASYVPSEPSSDQRGPMPDSPESVSGDSTCAAPATFYV
jgi:hypothetical protein